MVSRKRRRSNQSKKTRSSAKPIDGTVRRSNRLAGLNFMDSIFNKDKISITGRYNSIITNKPLTCGECGHDTWTAKTVAIGGRIGEAFDVNHFTDGGYVMHICDKCGFVKTFKDFLMTKEKHDLQGS